MPSFTIVLFPESNTRQKICKLYRDGKCDYEDFVAEIKKDYNLKPELGDLWAILKYVADGKTPYLRETKYRIVKKNLQYPVYEAKSANLRLYLFTDLDGMVIILGGKKTEQDEDIKRSEKVVKEYYEFQNKKK